MEVRRLRHKLLVLPRCLRGSVPRSLGPGEQGCEVGVTGGEEACRRVGGRPWTVLGDWFGGAVSCNRHPPTLRAVGVRENRLFQETQNPAHGHTHPPVTAKV